MIILGIDPGYATVGYGVVNYDRGRFAPVRFGAITTPPKTDFSARLEMIYDDMRASMASRCLSIRRCRSNSLWLAMGLQKRSR